MNESEAPRGMARTVVRGVGLAGGGYVIGQAINLAIYLVLARLVTPEEFGQFAAGAVVVQAGLYLTDSGLSAAIIQRRDRIEEAASTAVVATVLAGIGLGLAALAASPLIGRVFQSHEVTLVAAAASGWIVVRAFAIIPDALLQRRFSFMRRAVIDPLGIVVFGAVAITATARGMGVWGLVLGNYAQFAMMSVSSWVLARWRPRLGLASVAMWRELVRFGRHVMASGVMAQVSGTLSTAIIGRGFGTATLGQFRYGIRIIQAPLGALINAGSYVLFPAFSRISTDAERLQRGFMRAVRVTSSIAIPISFLLLPLGVPLAVLLFGEQWHEAGRLVSAMFAFTAARAYISLTREVFKASGRSVVLTKLQTVSGVLAVGLMVAAVPLGSTAVGASISLSSIGTAVYATHAVAQITGIPVRRIVGEMWPPVAASALMAAGLFGAELLVDADAHSTAGGLALLVGEGLAGVGVYLGVLAVIAPAHMRELVALAEHLPGRLGRRARPSAALEPESNAAPLP
jgi:O-antigen/teichoic acid export membrane protein